MKVCEMCGEQYEVINNKVKLKCPKCWPAVKLDTGEFGAGVCNDMLIVDWKDASREASAMRLIVLGFKILYQTDHNMKFNLIKYETLLSEINVFLGKLKRLAEFRGVELFEEVIEECS